jgi:hypothetical protein
MPGFSAGAAVVRPDWLWLVDVLSFEVSREVPDGPVPASRAWAVPLTSSAASAAAENANACFIDVSSFPVEAEFRGPHVTLWLMQRAYQSCTFRLVDAVRSAGKRAQNGAPGFCECIA